MRYTIAFGDDEVRVLNKFFDDLLYLRGKAKNELVIHGIPDSDIQQFAGKTDEVVEVLARILDR